MTSTVDDQIDSFLATKWGPALAEQRSARGLCKRASAALLARLQRAAIDAGLWYFTDGKPEFGLAPTDIHYVVVVDGEAIDVSARQFDPEAPVPRREPLATACSRWNVAGREDPDDSFMRPFPTNWRDLADSDPPGDIPGCPYDRHTLPDDSPWK
jgi:hypothetical protein